MKTKEVLQEKTVAVADFTKALCALAQEHLIGLVKTVGENEFIFSFHDFSLWRSLRESNP